MEIGRLFRISSKPQLVAILFFFFLVDGLGLWLAAKFDYDRIYDRAQIILQKTATSLDERMKRTITSTELILKYVAEEIQKEGIEQTISSRKEWERFRSYAKALPDVGSLWLINAKADLLMDSTQYPSQPMNFADREYFAPQRDKGIESYIGPLVKGRITKKFSFTITRRITNKDGGFAGILVAAIETDDFTNFLRNIRIGENGAVTIWRADGKLILRQPMEDQYLDKDFTQLKLFKIPFEESPSGFFLSEKTVDGPERLVAYQKMQGFPLVAVTSIPKASIRQAWLANVRDYTLIAIFALCGLIGLSWLVYRSGVREEAARKELENAHERVTKLNAELEQRVIERTAQLVAANKDLNNEISERKRAETTLREGEERLRFALETSHTGAWDLDLGDHTAYRSLEHDRIFGYEQLLPEWTYEMFLDHVLPEDRGAVDAKFRHAVGTQGDWSFECRIRRSDGQIRWIWAAGRHRTDTAGQSRRMAGIVQDITERKRAEEALRKTRDELEMRVQERTDELAKSQQRFQLLSSQLLLAQEKERKRVAVELHDGLLSELAAMKYLVEGKLLLLKEGKPSDLNEYKRVADILAIVMKEARGIMNNLHPSILDELGLISTINWLSEEYQKSYPHIKVQKQIEVSERDISDSVKVVIYRVLQEALNNFAKYGKGDLVELSLTKSGGTFAFMVRDNGQGFDVEKAQKGLGLESMRERVEISGGKFKIESVRGVGTTIQASWLLPDNL